MDFELRAAREKLEREQRERKERAKRKLERERKAIADAQKRREAIEAEQRERRIQAADALIKAEQQQQETLLLGQGIVFSRTLEALPYDGYGDKVKLPPSCFTELSDQGALDKGPMHFRLSRMDGTSAGQEHQTTHSGVLEFTAKEGSVELPSHVWNNLFSTDSIDVPLIEVKYVSLPKGTYAKLQPQGAGFSDIPNHKAVLETTLRKHATLSQGDIFTVYYGDLCYKLRVLELRPASSVSILETDIEVDIEGHESTLDGAANQHVLIPLVMGKVESATVDEGMFHYYKFSIEDSISALITSGSMNIEVKVDAETSEGDTNVYVSKHPLVFPTQHRHEWSSYEIGSKILLIGGEDPSLVSGTYSIGVFGYKGSTKYHISVALKEINMKKMGENATSSSQVDLDAVQCKNCKHFISGRTIMLHEAYCFRHNVPCKHDGCGVVLRKEEAGSHVHCNRCGKAFHQGEIEKHMKVFHEPIYCPCGMILEKEEMVQHQATNCPLRLIACRFCGDMVQAGNMPIDARDRMRGLSEHESICGSRTAPCDSCGRTVMLKEMDIHNIAVHQKS